MTAAEKSQPTLEQRRARHAYEAVQRAQQKEGAQEKQDPKKFGGQARKLPIRIVASGLGQALAFLKSKNYAPGLLVEIADWVLDQRTRREGDPPRDNQRRPSDDALLRHVIEGNSDTMRRATAEVLAYLVWLNRFAEAEGLSELEGSTAAEGES